MPPKKAKDLGAAPVYGLPHERQVSLLSDALLREYMHRRGFLATLKAFDSENPRDDDTISSRAVMADLMAVDAADQQRLKAVGIETIMEMLCDLRVERRQQLEDLAARAQQPLPEVPADLLALQEEQQRRRQRRRRSSGKAVDSSSSEEGDGTDDDEDDDEGAKARRAKAAKKKKNKKKQRGKQRVGHGERHDSGSGGGASLPPPDQLGGLTIEDLLGSSSSSASGAAHSELTGGALTDGSPTTAPMDKPGTAHPVGVAWIQSQEEEAAAAAAEGGGGSDSDGEGAAPSPLPPGAQPLTEPMTRAACRVLCGEKPVPPAAFLRQGFTFDENLDCALIQWARGPGAAIAAVQAFVFAYYYEREVYTERGERLRACLRRALLAILREAQPTAATTILVDGRFARRGSTADPTKRFHRRMGSSFHYFDRFASPADIEARLEQLLDAWTEPRGCGLWCFLLSLVLSRGCAAVERDMDTPHALITAASGDGTVELANLCLCGRALSGTTGATAGRKGYAQPLACGLLDAERPVLYDDANPSEARAHCYASEPLYPSWVVQYKGHFRNLFQRKDTRKSFAERRELGGAVSAEICYWDALTEDDVFQLAVEVTGIGSGSAGFSFVNTAVRSIPIWATGTVDWNGEKPVRE